MQSSTIINGNITALGIPENAKLQSGPRSPEIAPAYCPASSPTRIIGRNVSPSEVPTPEIAPIAWNICGAAALRAQNFLFKKSKVDCLCRKLQSASVFKYL